MDNKSRKNISENEEETVVFEDVGDEESRNIDGAAALSKLREKLKKCEEEKKEYLDGWQRAKADFINTRKEEEERRKDLKKIAEENVVSDFLVLTDSFESLFRNKELLEKIDKNWLMGVEYIYNQFLGILKTRGFEVMETIGKKFDFSEHESVGETKVDSLEKEGIITEEVRKGYKLNGKIIRAPQVKVGKCE